MKTFYNNLSLIDLLAVCFAFVAFGFVGPITAFAATSPTLVGSTDYSVLGASTVTCTGATTVSGNVGVAAGTAITGFPDPCIVSPGTTQSDTQSAIAAQADNVNAFASLDQTCDHTYPNGQDLASLSPLGPGVYCSAGSFSLSGNLNLTGSGVWIFKSASTLITSTNSSVTGGDPCNVWWRVGSSATLGTTTAFKGNILALASITLNTGATLNGRAMAQTGAVTLDGNAISGPICAVPSTPATTCTISASPNPADSGGTSAITWSSANATSCNASGGSSNWSGVRDTSGSWISGSLTQGYTYSMTCTGPGGSTQCNVPVTLNATPAATENITVIKVVVGGTKTDFPLFVGNAPVKNGDTNSFAAPALYAVTETSDPNYTATYSADCPNGIVNLVVGTPKACTITNTYNVPASGGGGGSAYTPPVPPIIDVVKVPSPLALPTGPGPVAYTYTLRNIGTVGVANITVADNSCSPVTLISGDTNADTRLETNETWTYRCSAALAATHTNTVVATGWANGISATDIASATVIVGAQIVPPLINVTKVPSPLTLPAGGGFVSYTEKITNPGTVALSNVSLADDKCGPMEYISGDTNGDSKLDTDETWTYNCRTNLVKTTTNTAIAEGEANGLTVRDLAIATVVVAAAAPKLPNTGIAPDGKNIPWDFVILTALALVSTLVIIVLRKRAS